MITVPVVERSEATGPYSEGWNARLDAEGPRPEPENPYADGNNRVTWGSAWSTCDRQIRIAARKARQAAQRNWRRINADVMDGWHREADANGEGGLTTCGRPIPEDAKYPAPDMLGSPFSACKVCKR